MRVFSFVLLIEYFTLESRALRYYSAECGGGVRTKENDFAGAEKRETYPEHSLVVLSSCARTISKLVRTIVWRRIYRTRNIRPGFCFELDVAEEVR